MFKPVAGLAFSLCVLTGCNSDDKKNEEGATASGLADRFKTVKAYQLTEADLFATTDTTTINGAFIKPLLIDSASTIFFSKAKAYRYIALAKVKKADGPTILIVKTSLPIKAVAAARNAALAIALDSGDKPVTAIPFLLVGNDPNTTQIASIDKNLTITKSTTKREGNEVVGEGKEVWAFDAKAKAFSLVVLDPFDDDATAARNPIDTFPQTNRLAGDYLSGKKGIVSVRDGRHPNQLLVYVHTEDASGDCVGQMKGEFTMTSNTTAAYRQGGDPCVLNLSFRGTTVAIAEGSGCGNYRGLDCPFTGTFTKKKQAAPKATAAKPRRR